jgi:cobaltochelatase CobN
VLLKKQILELAGDTGLRSRCRHRRYSMRTWRSKARRLWLCDLKELQIRDGLHVFGVSPEGRLLTDLTVALARVPRGTGEGGEQSLQRAIAGDAGLGVSTSISPLVGEMSDRTEGGKVSASFESVVTPSVGRADISPTRGEINPERSFDPLDCILSDPWTGPKPAILADVSDAPWRTAGDTVERIELLAARLVSGELPCPEDWAATRAVLHEVETRLKPSIVQSGPAEIAALMTGLDGRFVSPGPSGAPTRGSAGCAADRPQFLFGRQPGRADADGVRARQEIG